MHEAGYPIKMEEILSMVKKPISTSDTIHIRPFIIRDQRTLTKSDYPLIIIGGRRFKEMTFSNIYFDLSNVSHMSVINLKNDSIKLFGHAGRNGVIIVETKNKIEWITSNAIRRKYFKWLLFWHKKAAFKINGSIINPTSNVYIQKDLIKSIKINSNGFDVYETKEYHRVINVELKNVMGAHIPAWLNNVMKLTADGRLYGE